MGVIHHYRALEILDRSTPQMVLPTRAPTFALSGDQGAVQSSAVPFPFGLIPGAQGLPGGDRGKATAEVR